MADEKQERKNQTADAASLRPKKRTTNPEGEALRPKKKDAPTPTRKSAEAGTGGEVAAKRVNPVQFVRECADELRKVVWPDGDQLKNYFIVVLIFLLFVIAYVSLLDTGFGWLLLKIFG